MNEVRLMNRPSGGEFDGTPFLGEVPAMIPNSSIAVACGISAGTVINEGQPWLKFLYKGKTLYVPKKPIRYGVTWRVLYEAGAVHGTDTYDVKFANVANTLQNRRVSLEGSQYRIRLLTGAVSNPYSGAASGDAPALGLCEWNELFYPIINDPIVKTYTGPKIRKPYLPAELGHSTSQGGQCLTRTLTNASGTGYILTRGNNASVAESYNGNTGTAGSQLGWRPCLELIP